MIVDLVVKASFTRVLLMEESIYCVSSTFKSAERMMVKATCWQYTQDVASVVHWLAGPVFQWRIPSPSGESWRRNDTLIHLTRQPSILVYPAIKKTHLGSPLPQKKWFDVSDLRPIYQPLLVPVCVFLFTRNGVRTIRISLRASTHPSLSRLLTHPSLHTTNNYHQARGLSI